LPCTTTSDCSSPDVCDTGQGACAECLDDSQCANSSEPKCIEEQCVQCQSAQDCPSGELCWQAACVQCVTDANCPEGGTCSTDHACN
jgi:Cys-rich repeat protein